MTRTSSMTYSKAPGRYDGIERYAQVANGPYLYDTEGREYIDYVAGLGPVILGHQWPSVTDAVIQQIQRGNCYSLPTKLEEQLGEILAQMVPCAEASRFAKNGADATEMAVRLARAVTGRDLVLRCGYHGCHDSLIEDSRGIPRDVQRLRVDFPFNNLHWLRGLMDEWNYAAVILEPVPTRIVAWPHSNFLHGVRELCDQHNCLLIFDETVTGFRIHEGGAQAYFGVTPDLATFSKGMANGFPISALCGKSELMKEFQNGVFFSTTFGGDPIGLTAAIATLTVIREQQVPQKLGELGDSLRETWNHLASRNGIAPCLKGYPQRLVEVWAEEQQQMAFRRAVIGAGVLTQGYYNLMLAHNAETTSQTVAAWAAGFKAAAACA